MKRQAGFNLIELALVLAILGILLGGLISPLVSQLEANQTNQVRQTLDKIQDALIGYAQIHGRLPCPATISSDGLSAPNIATVVCTEIDGFVPGRTLGLSGNTNADNLLIDPWLRPIHYRLTGAASGAYSNEITLGLVPDLQICAETGCASILADSVVAILYSTGSSLASSSDQLENLDEDLVFVKHDFTEASGNEFDDHLLWISPNTLVYELVRSGQLD